MRVAMVIVVVAAFGCDSKCPPDAHCNGVHVADSGMPDAFEACPRRRTSACNPLTQAGCAAGEKCTWIVDAVAPTYVGHVGCAPIGVADVGAPCTYGPPGCDGYDGCKTGLVCSAYRGGEGVCKQLCDQQGGLPSCDDAHACVTYPDLFTFGNTMAAPAGVCDVACDPLADNDFDGSGTQTKTATTCGSDAAMGCYGYPSFGTPPRTAWSCMAELHPAASLRHRTQCTELTGCAGPGETLSINSCSQGYLPLLRETSATTSSAICVALCKPKNCYLGNCGTNDDNRLGEAPHRCNGVDRVGSFDTSAGGEHCRFLWYYERDDGAFLRSPTSDRVGVCVDHAKYGAPACATLTLAEAVEHGCVDTTLAQLAQGQAQ